MQDILRDPLWQIVGIVIALVAVALSIVIPILQRRIKRLSYEVLSHNALLSVDKEITSRVQILLDGKPIKDAALSVVRIINSGNVPITANDHERPICLKFGHNARILSYEVTETSPESLQPELTVEDKSASSLTLEPLLMNEGDSISVKVLISEIGDAVQIDGRIMGVRTIGEYKRPQPGRLLILSLGVLVVLLLGLVGILVVSEGSASSLERLAVNVFILGFGVSSVWLIGRPERWGRWGYILGLCSQPFWLYMAFIQRDRGVFLISCLYAYAWGQAVWFHWIRRKAVV